jgi:signal transduction histidine kinase/methyl-accepting chemotaxis protein
MKIPPVSNLSRFFGKFRWGLKLRFVFTISFLILFTSAILSGFLIKKQSELIQRELEKRGESLVKNLAYNSEYGVLVENKDLLMNLIQGLSQQEDIAYIIIQDRNGSILAELEQKKFSPFFHKKKNYIESQVFKKEGPSGAYHTHLSEEDGGEFANFSCPIQTTKVLRSKEEVGMVFDQQAGLGIKEEKIGVAHVGMSLDNMHKESASMKNIIVLLTALVVGIGILLTIFLANIIVKPIQKLVFATDKVANGDLAQMVKVRRKDEIGKLAFAFNRMTNSLKESRNQIEEYNRTLENKVKERTTDLERTTRALQAEYNRLDAIINSPNVGIVIEDKDCNIKFMNKSLIDAFGNQIGEKCYEKFKGRKEKCEVCPIDEILIKGKKTFNYFDQDYARNHYALSAALFQDEKGEKYILETIRDITEQKKLEMQVEAYTRDLEKTNVELKHALKNLRETQAQLIQAEKMAGIGQLAAGVAHELNNPLGGILGYCQFAIEKITKKSLKELTGEDISTYSQYLKDIEQQSKRCKAIIQSLLKFSRASVKENLEPTDVNSVLKETFVFVKHQMEKHKVKLEEVLSPSLPPINGNVSQLQQVFTNLILNAIQAMPEGGKLIVLDKVSEDKKSIEISFADTGEGITKKNLDKIFEPFFTTKKVGQGTGLGLSVSYGIVKDHGGDIQVESTVGQGTIFTVVLPIIPVEFKGKKSQTTEPNDKRTYLEKVNVNS